MKWEDMTIFQEKCVGEDKLGNPIYDFSEYKTVKVRKTPWTDEQISIEDREVTKNEQRYIIRAPFEDISACKRVRMNGVLLEVTEKSDLSPRFSIIQVKVYKE